MRKIAKVFRCKIGINFVLGKIQCYPSSFGDLKLVHLHRLATKNWCILNCTRVGIVLHFEWDFENDHKIVSSYCVLRAILSRLKARSKRNANSNSRT